MYVVHFVIKKKYKNTVFCILICKLGRYYILKFKAKKNDFSYFVVN